MNRFFGNRFFGDRSYTPLESSSKSTGQKRYQNGPERFFEKRRQAESAISEKLTSIREQFSNYQTLFSDSDKKSYELLNGEAEKSCKNAVNDIFAQRKTLEEYVTTVEALNDFVSKVTTGNDKNNPLTKVTNVGHRVESSQKAIYTNSDHAASELNEKIELITSQEARGILKELAKRELRKLKYKEKICTLENELKELSGSGEKQKIKERIKNAKEKMSEMSIICGIKGIGLIIMKYIMISMEKNPRNGV